MSDNRQVYRKSNILGVLIIAAICIVIIVATSIAGNKVKAQNEYYTQLETELGEQITKEHERTGEIEEYGRYVNSDEFARKAAREKFGLVTDDEIVLKENDSNEK